VKFLPREGFMNHKELDAWNLSMQLVEEVYKVSSSFPKQEMYGMTSQIRRAVVSVPSNLSEGAARNSNKEFINFLGVSLGSLAEVETQLLIASRLGYADINELLPLLGRVRALIIALKRYLLKSMN
jgi:four helix bundle protein